MNKLPFVIGLAVALSPSLGLTMPGALVSPRRHPRSGDQEPHPKSDADQERIAAAQAKRERKAARLAAILGAS